MASGCEVTCSVARRGLVATLAALLAVSGPQSAGAPERYVPTDDGVGPTCAYYLGMGNMSWSRAGGDWVDAAGARYGGTPFDAGKVAATSGRQTLELDVSGLVRSWLDGSHRNAGLLLRAQPGTTGVAAIHSRESPDVGARPSLVLEWADRSRTRLAPAADTHLDCSSLSSLGAQPQLLVSAEHTALLYFALPAASTARLTRARLSLVSDRQYGSGATVGVYRADPPYARPQGMPELGIAQGYVLDAHLDEHPAVLMAAGFESPLWFLNWIGLGWLRSHVQAVQEDPQRKFEPLSGRALRVTLKRGTNLGLDLSYAFRSHRLPEPEEIYFRYYLRLADDWNPSVEGGKLPGLAGTYGQAGWGMRKTDGYNGWSLRGDFSARPPNAPSVSGLTAVGSYAYHADIEDAAGEHWAWSDGPAGVLVNNRWYCIEQYVKLNTPGERNGILRAWVDGRRVLERSDVRFRHVAALKIERVWLNVYHGGSLPAPRDMSLYIDNMVIARQYIGPVKQ